MGLKFLLGAICQLPKSKGNEKNAGFRGASESIEIGQILQESIVLTHQSGALLQVSAVLP